MSESSSNGRRLVFDTLAAVMLLLVALAGCFLPRFLSLRGKASGNERSLLFQLGNMLSAGVMLSACFCHLLADAVKTTEKEVPNFPLAQFLCALGFLLTLAADSLASKLAGHHDGNAAEKKQLLNEPQQPAYVLLTTNEATDSATGIYTAVPQSPGAGTHLGENLETLEIDGNDRTTGPRVSFLTALFLGMALSLHSVLEGLALGAQQTIHASKEVLLAIGAHKGLAAYALGASLVDSKTTRIKYWRVAGAFSIASPIGIMVGYVLSEVSDNLGAAALSALASGTFLYVALMEVIPKELNDSKHVTSKLAALFLGFGAMSILAIWA